jgi:alkanesulfonate monooxygenase SsuD/methylene tetrahydromethanopterin reductase-like flavin-dependent oxidoreductase (luciferase family)
MRSEVTVQQVQFSVWPDPAHAPTEVIDIAHWAERRGWFGLWYADHYMPNTGTLEIRPGDMHECWAMLAAIAAVTTKIRIGSLVSPTSVHHPAVLANRSATIDHISGGRMVLGLGAGWQINEHHAYGIELEPPGPRVTRFEEAVKIVRSLHTQPRTTFEGSVYTIRDAIADPKPVQSPLPILVGTASPRMLRITGRLADEWNTWGGRQWAAERRATFETAMAGVGRDLSTIHTSVQALIAITDSDAVRDKVLAGAMGPRSIAGSVDELVDTLGWYRELGFDEFIVPDFNLGSTPAERAERLDQIDRQLVAQLK